MTTMRPQGGAVDNMGGTIGGDVCMIFKHAL